MNNIFTKLAQIKVFGSFSRFQTLKHLSLGGNPLKVIPEAVFSLVNLEDFRPYSCGLTDLDER